MGDKIFSQIEVDDTFGDMVFLEDLIHVVSKLANKPVQTEFLRTLRTTGVENEADLLFVSEDDLAPALFNNIQARKITKFWKSSKCR